MKLLPNICLIRQQFIENNYQIKLKKFRGLNLRVDSQNIESFEKIFREVTPDTYKSGQALKNVFFFDIKLIFIKLYTVR